jgi:hypothetical protein
LVVFFPRTAATAFFTPALMDLDLIILRFLPTVKATGRIKATVRASRSNKTAKETPASPKKTTSLCRCLGRLLPTDGSHGLFHAGLDGLGPDNLALLGAKELEKRKAEGSPKTTTAKKVIGKKRKASEEAESTLLFFFQPWTKEASTVR